MIDTRVAGPAQGFVALAAARAIASGRELEAVLHVVQSVQGNDGLIAVFDILKFIAESGRVKEARRWMSSAIRVYPIITFVQGRIRIVGLARTKSNAMERMIR